MVLFKGLPPHSAGLRKALHRRGERVGKGAKGGREGGGESRREVQVVSGKHGDVVRVEQGSDREMAVRVRVAHGLESWKRHCA